MYFTVDERLGLHTLHPVFDTLPATGVPALVTFLVYFAAAGLTAGSELVLRLADATGHRVAQTRLPVTDPDHDRPVRFAMRSPTACW
jgi:hypothetical protein